MLIKHSTPKRKKPRRKLTELSGRLRENAADLAVWVKGRPAEYAYHSFSIPKRSGRPRFIDAPNDLLIKLQRKVYKRLLIDEPLQNVVTGFVRGRSIVDNVEMHLDSQIIVKVDLKDFFASIDDERVDEFWRGLGWDAQCSAILTQICCKDGALPQGAPTSPALSNLVNRGFDGRLYSLARRYESRYTRYADDLTFSWPKHHATARKRMRSLIDELKRILHDEGYEIQRAKGIKILRPHQRQIVTGLVINERVNLPRETRRKIRVLKHLSAYERLSDVDRRRLEGYELLEHMIKRKSKAVAVPIGSAQAAVPAKFGQFQTLNVEVVAMKNIIKGDQIFGDQNNVSGNAGGIRYVGKFQNIRTQMISAGHQRLADALNKLLESIEISPEFSLEEKQETSQVIREIGEEIVKDQPSKTRIKMLWGGVVSLLSISADVAQIATAVAPIISAVTG